MTKIVQISGGTRANQDIYTGPDREVTAVTDIDELRLHDGITPGGARFPNKAQNDLSYQPKHVDLIALSEFGSTVGIVTRIGAGTYVLRDLEVVQGELVVTNPLGLAANPLFGLPTIITKLGLSFLESVTFTAGVVGNVTGNVAGNVTGNLVGNVTGNLAGNAVGAHSGSFVGAVDARGAALLLDDAQIPLPKVAASLVLTTDDRLPSTGMITLWSGAIVNIPTGWALCDGANGTPNLTDRFVVGAGAAYAPADVGGAAAHVHGVTIDSGGSHTHVITVDPHALSTAEMPAHFHNTGMGLTGAGSAAIYGSDPVTHPWRIESNNNGATLNPQSAVVGGTAAHPHTGSADTHAGHAHTGSTANGSSLPPYYALAYIMKL